MCLEQHVWDGDLALQVRSLAVVPRIFDGAKIIPRPAIKGAIMHARNKIGNKIVAELVALVDRTPDIAGLGMRGESNTITDSACVDPSIPATGVEHEYGCAIGLISPC